MADDTSDPPGGGGGDSQHPDAVAARLAAQREAKAEARAIHDLEIRGLEVNKENVEVAKAMTAARKSSAEYLENNITHLNSEIKLLEEISKKEDSIRKRLFKGRELKEAELELDQTKLKLNERKLKDLDKSGSAGQAEYERLKKAVKVEQKKVEQGQKALGIQTKSQKASEKSRKIGEDIVGSIAKSALQQSKLGSATVKGYQGVSQMLKFSKMLTMSLRAGAISAGMLTAALGIGIILLVVAAIAKLVEWTIGLSIKTRDLTVAFQRATGASAKYGVAVADIERDMRAVGVTTEEAHKAQMSLYKSTTDYTMASPGQQKALYKTTALMGEFGVSTDTSAKIAQHATKGLGMELGETSGLMLRLSAHASDIGVPINKMMEDFAAVGNQMKAFGRDGERVFTRLAMVQKITGMEMQRLLSITDKFDTFEGAAKQAGQLNAALGGNFVNAMDLMMETDPVERFSMLRDSIMDSAGSFDDMSYYQRKFYASSLGLKDVGELAAMMSGDFEALDGNIGQTSADFEKQREKAKNWQSTMEALKNTLAAFAPPMTAIAAKIQPIIEEFTKSEKSMKRLGDVVEKVMTGLLSDALDDLPGKIERFVTGFTKFTTWISNNEKLIKDLITDLKLLANGIYLLYYPQIKLIQGLGWLIMQLGKLWTWLHKRGSWNIMEWPSEMAKGVRALSEAFGTGGLVSAIRVALKWIKDLWGELHAGFGGAIDKVIEKVKGFVAMIPGTWAEAVLGIKTEMEISSDSKVMTKIAEQSHVGPIKSVAAQMPGLVKDAYKDVPKIAAKELEPLTGTPQKQGTGMMAAANIAGEAYRSTLLGRIGDAVAGAPVAAAEGAGGSTSTTVNIPIHIGKDALGTVVGEIVDGKLGAVSWQGALGIGGSLA